MQKAVSPAGLPAEPETSVLVAWCDGACAGNPGPMGIGGVIKTVDGVTLAQFSQAVGTGSNNVAEYRAVLQALELARQLGARQLTVWTDSELVVRQLSGRYAVRNDRLREWWRQVKAVQRALADGAQVRWTPRAHNQEADALASRAVGLPQAPLTAAGVVLWKPDPAYAPAPAALARLPPAPPAVAGLLRCRTAPRFRDFMTLRVGGMDGYSTLRREALEPLVAVRFGPTAVVWLRAALADQLDSLYGLRAWRWCARGLPPDWALKKASVDSERYRDTVTPGARGRR